MNFHRTKKLLQIVSMISGHGTKNCYAWDLNSYGLQFWVVLLLGHAAR